MTSSSTKPRILITTSTNRRERGLRRDDVVGGLNYAEAVLKTGGLPTFAPNLAPDTVEAFVANADGVLLSGGADLDPFYFGQTPHQALGVVDDSRDVFELELYRAAKRQGIPVLGICRGIQVINVAEGGTLHQHLPAVSGTLQHEQRNIDGTPFHAVRLEEGSRLAQAFGKPEVRTDSYHHQAIDQLGRDLKATGWTADDIVEVVEGTGETFVLGVQWHPEMSFARYPEHLVPFELFMESVLSRAERFEAVEV